MNNLDKTFVMLKPDAIEQGLCFAITAYFKQYGFVVEVFDLVKADDQKLEDHYFEVFEKYGPDFQSDMKKYFSGNYVLPMILYRKEGDAVETARKMIGATNPQNAAKGTVRGDLSEDSYEKAAAEKRALRNLIHASDSPENAKREALIWLPGYIF